MTTLRQTLGRRERLLKSADFRRVRGRKRPFRNGPFALWAEPNGLDVSRLGISIRSRDVRLASQRNRLKRLAKEVFRKNKQRLKKGFDLVLGINCPLAPESSYAAVEELFLKLAGMAKILILPSPPAGGEGQGEGG
jgi:ribonuclease P protein component